jgi:Flp pilus assembly protein TadG
MSGRRRTRDDEGQAAVELVALAPLLLVVVLAAAQLLAAGAAAELADHAAEAGAVALLQSEDPQAAAREAVPRWSRTRMAVRVQGRTVRVRMRPPSPIPGLGELLEVTRRADAGPKPR